MPDPRTELSRTPKRIGIAADHGGFELKEQLARTLREAGYEVIDFGDRQPKPDDDYPDAMQRLIEIKDRFEIASACDTDHDRHGIVTRSAGLLPPHLRRVLEEAQAIVSDTLAASPDLTPKP
jgi:phosphoglucomutase